MLYLILSEIYMSFQEEVAKLAQEGSIGVVWLIGDDEKIYYTYGEWGVDPLIPFKALKNQTRDVDFGGMRFAVITVAPDRLISTSTTGHGHVMVAKCPKWAGAVVSWTPKEILNTVAFANTARLAGKVR